MALLFTVFTPTFNRAHTLPRVYASLIAQTWREFEWLIVDDGSTDGTETLVRRWIAEGVLAIRYVRQDNGGKHAATNRGVREARGALFLTLDSDDECVPWALARFAEYWGTIPAGDRARFSAVTARCMDHKGHLIGNPQRRDVLDSDSVESVYRFGLTGERWGFQRTDVMREFPFPETGTTTHVPEGVVWRAIAKRYKTRYVSDVLRIYHTDGPSLIRNPDIRAHAPGMVQENAATLNEALRFFRFAPVSFLRAAVHYARGSMHVGLSAREQRRALRGWGARALWLLAFPVGYAVFRRDRQRHDAMAHW